MQMMRNVAYADRVNHRRNESLKEGVEREAVQASAGVHCR